MIEFSEFELFSSGHLWTIAIVFILSVGLSYFIKHLSPKIQPYVIRYVAWTLVLFESFKPFYRTAWLGESWKINLPFYLCNLSIYMLAYILFRRSYKAYEIVYFWAFAGALMALITPDVPAGYPHPEYLMFFTNHGLIIFGIILVSMLFHYRPQTSSIGRAFKTGCIVLVMVFPLNYLLGDGANYLYLRDKPQVGSLMDFMPNPPFHIPVVMLLAYLFFWIVYLPYFLKDMYMNRKNAL